jgi:hypothetical protein
MPNAWCTPSGAKDLRRHNARRHHPKPFYKPKTGLIVLRSTFIFLLLTEKVHRKHVVRGASNLFSAVDGQWFQ